MEGANIAVLRVAKGGLAGAARGPEPATPALRAAQGRAMPPGRLGWAMERFLTEARLTLNQLVSPRTGRGSAVVSSSIVCIVSW